MNFKYKDCNGNVLPVNCEVGKIVIYGNGNKLFERELTLETYTIKETDNGEKKLSSVYRGEPVTVTLSSEVKTARKENLNRKDNYTLAYTPEYFKWERRAALYIYVSEVDVTDLGNMLAMETVEEKNYLHAFVLHFNGPVTFERLHTEYIQCDGAWTIPDNGRWSDSYGTLERPCYDTYGFTNSPFKRAREKGKGVVKRYITFETIERGAEIVTAERYYTKTVYSADRERKNAIADKLNASGVYSDRERWSHYDIDKLEKALGRKLEV